MFALALQLEDEEALRKSPLVRFNLARAASLAHQIRKKTRGNKRRWSLTESEAQRWAALGAAARLNWLVRVEKKGLKGGQERKHSRKKQKVEVHTRERARTPDERHGEEEGGQRTPTPRPQLADKTGRRSTLEQWMQREGGPPEARQKKRVDLPGSKTTATSDGTGATPQPDTYEGGRT